MKRIIILLAFIFVSSVFSQSLVLDISYLRIENDKNRSTRTEKFSILSSSSSYTLEYTGKWMPNEGNEVKNCDLSSAALNDIVKSVQDNKVAVNESFYAKERTNGESLFYVIISVKMVYDGTPYEILLDGESNLVMENRNYIHVIELIKDLRRIIKDC
ncbi:MAG: hypothetical protein ABI543_15725 [Ignavibacteria bacterium]